MEDTYFDEYILFCQQIKRRRNSHYRILLAIATNPHSEEPEALWQVFNDEYQPSYTDNEQLDREAFDRLKLAMADNPKLIIK